MTPPPRFITDMGPGPFRDEVDPNLDRDIAGVQALPPLQPIESHHTIARRDYAWQAHYSRNYQWHALHIRMTASEERAKHRVIVRELKATHNEEMEELRGNHECELTTSLTAYDDAFDEHLTKMKRDQEETIEAMRRAWQTDVIRLTEELNFSRRIIHIFEEFEERRMREDEAAQRVMGACHPADARETMDNTGIEVAIHHPNNVKRAKDIRVQRRATDDNSWAALENLSQQAGGLPIRRQRLAQGLPTPQGMNETVRLIGGYWIDPSREIEEGMGQDYTTAEDADQAGPIGHYRRGNGNVTRSGRLITRQTSTTKIDKWLGRTQTHEQVGMQGGPRSAKTLREMEKEMTKEMTREKLAPAKFEGPLTTSTDIAGAAAFTPTSTDTSESTSGGVAITAGVMDNNSPTHHEFNVEAYGNGNGYDRVMNNGGPRTA